MEMQHEGVGLQFLTTLCNISASYTLFQSRNYLMRLRYAKLVETLCVCKCSASHCP